MSEATFHKWRKKYSGLLPSEMRRLRQLEEENGKQKWIVADLSLDKAMLHVKTHTTFTLLCKLSNLLISTGKMSIKGVAFCVRR